MKLDNNIYLKINYEYENKFNFYVDLQSRNIEYTFEGKDNDGNNAEQKINLTFFNPKLEFIIKLIKLNKYMLHTRLLTKNLIEMIMLRVRQIQGHYMKPYIMLKLALRKIKINII